MSKWQTQPVSPLTMDSDEEQLQQPQRQQQGHLERLAAGSSSSSTEESLPQPSSELLVQLQQGVVVVPTRKQIIISGGPPWGFRVCGGRDTNIPLKIVRVTGSKAARSGIRDGDFVTAINGESVGHLTNGEVQRMLKKSGPSLTLELKSARRMNAFEGSASTTGELVESAGASSGVVVSKKLLTTGDTGVGPGSTSATSVPSINSTTSDNNLQQPTQESVGPGEDSGGVQLVVVDGGGGGGGSGGRGKKKKSPSHTSNGKSSSKSSGSKKKTVEFKERSVDEPPPLTQPPQNGTADTEEIDEGIEGSATEKQGVWAPGSTNSSQPSSPATRSSSQQQEDLPRRGSKSELLSESSIPALEEPLPVVWTPPSNANAPSPSSQKKFRPVNFNLPPSPTSSTPRVVSLERSVSAGQVGSSSVGGGVSSDKSFLHQHQQQQQQQQQQQRQGVDSVDRVEGGGHSQQQIHQFHQSQSSPTVNLPKYQSPTVTLLQKAREGSLKKGALYLDHKIAGVQRSSSASGGFNSVQQHPATASPSSYSQQQQPSSSSLNPNDTLYELKKEDYSRTPSGTTITRRVEFAPRKYDGVGPTTSDGVPIALKSGTANGGHEWYRRMYESLHVDHKPHRKGAPVRSPYGGPSSGSYSEPEGYDSDTYAYKYATLDRRKLRDRYLSDTEYLSPGPSTPTSIPGSIRFTPGRIEDYTPGNSSVAAKEIRRHKPTLQWALGSKDLGYESDSNLVIRKRISQEAAQGGQQDNIPPPLSPAEQRQVYVEIQKGGEVPLHGLRKTAPEKHKEYEGGINGPIPPNRNSQNRIQSPPPPTPPLLLLPNSNRSILRRMSHDEDGDECYERMSGKQIENQSPFVESQSQFRRAQLMHNYVSHESQSSPAASPLLPASPVKYAESSMNIHYRVPVRLVEKDFIGEEELRRRQQIAMKRFYEEQRHRKFLAEIQDMENRRHTDNFTPSQKSPIPLNRYEDFIDDSHRPRGWREKTPDQKLIAKALFNFIPQNSRELSFRKGDILYIRRKLDANWFEGEHNAAVGIFPSSYVQIIPSYDIDRATPSIPSEGQARVRFNFTAASPVEMSIIKGETVVLTRRVDANWYEGRIGSRRGIFPVSYVQVLKEPGSDLTASLSPKPVGSPAAHSLAAHQNQNFRHNYKPNDYAVNSPDFSSLLNNSSTTIPTFSSAGRLSGSSSVAGGGIGSGGGSGGGGQNQGRSLYSQNLTIDTRIEPLSYKAIYNYKPAHDDELELQENDIVHVLEQCDDGWMVGISTRTGLFGTFPGNYVCKT